MAKFIIFAILAAGICGALAQSQSQQPSFDPQQFQSSGGFWNGPPPGHGNRNGPPPPGGPRMDDPSKAVVRLTQSTTVQGVIVFTRSPTDMSVVRITGNVTGLPPNSAHGFHIHESGDITNGCVGAGAHFNPRGVSHGAPTDDSSARHDGDLGNIFADQSGHVNLDATYDFIHLGGPGSVLGRAVVVHEKVDDLGQGGTKDSKTTGNAGSRLACGVIAIMAA